MQIPVGLRRWVSGVIVLATGLLLGGCIKDKVVVQVNKDGSGRILVTRLYPRESAEMMLGQIKAMAQQFEGRGMPDLSQTDPFFNEKAIKREAGRFGADVRFVKASPVNHHGARGYVAVYQFKDINDVFIDLQQRSQQASMSMYGGMGMLDEDGELAGMHVEKSPQSYEFRFTPGETASLKILIPDFSGAGGVEEAEETADEPEATEDDTEEDFGAEDFEGMQMMGLPYGGRMAQRFMGAEGQQDAARRMLRGMTMNVSVEVLGRPVKSTASHPDPVISNRWTLVSLDMDKILASPRAGAMMGKRGLGGMESLFGGGDDKIGRFLKLPGAVVETNREVVVQFN